MSWDWQTAVKNARELATAAKDSERQGQHIPTLIKCILDLCDAMEDLADKAGIERRDESE